MPKEIIKNILTTRKKRFKINNKSMCDHFVGLALKGLNFLRALNDGVGKTLLTSTGYTATLYCVRDRL